MHCFTGDAQQAREALDLGFHLSFGGVLTFPKAEAVRQAARITPDDRLLVETDCPYLAPVPHRGKRNEPAFVVETREAPGGGARAHAGGNGGADHGQFRAAVFARQVRQQLNWLTYMNLGKLGQALTAREIFDLIQDDLEQVEKKITAESVASVDAVTAIGQYLQSSGGKRLRPALLLLSAQAVRPRPARTAIQLGAVVEMIHAATLVHDDVIDAAADPPRPRLPPT